MVLSFRRKAGNRKPDDTEDLMQEARLALWMRACAADTPEDAERYFIHVHRALFEYVRGMAAVRVPSKKFTAHIRTVYVLSWESGESDEPDNGFEGELISRLDCQRFLDSLEPLERDILTLKMEGYSQRQIADLLVNGSESRISRLMRGIRDKYIAHGRERIHAS